MYDYFIGVDPGSYGAVSVIDKEGKLIEILKMGKTLKDNLYLLSNYKGKLCFGITENVHAQPGNGAVGAFTFGYNVCIADSMLIVSEIPHERIGPARWMNFFNMKKEKDESDTAWKERLYGKAQQLFPSEKFYKYAADSLLIAEYCRRLKLGIG